jgi:hypothetical protein
MRLSYKASDFCNSLYSFAALMFQVFMLLLLLVSLAPQPTLGLGLLLKIRLNFLEASQQFSFLQGRVVSPTHNPHPRGPGLCIYIPQRQGGYPFWSPLTTRVGYGGTILIPRSPHGEDVYV